MVIHVLDETQIQFSRSNLHDMRLMPVIQTYTYSARYTKQNFFFFYKNLFKFLAVIQVICVCGHNIFYFICIISLDCIFFFLGNTLLSVNDIFVHITSYICVLISRSFDLLWHVLPFLNLRIKHVSICICHHK